MTEVARISKGSAPKAAARAVLESIALAMEPRPIKAGDRVRWNGLYEGRVLAVAPGDTALVEEPNNRAFGRPVEWRLLLSSLTRVGPC